MKTKEDIVIVVIGLLGMVAVLATMVLTKHFSDDPTRVTGNALIVMAPFAVGVLVRWFVLLHRQTLRRKLNQE